jgi:hypothetical protein
MACYGDSFIFLCVDNVRTSQETLMGFHSVLLGIALVGDVRTSQETYASTVSYGDRFTLLLHMLRKSPTNKGT